MNKDQQKLPDAENDLYIPDNLEEVLEAYYQRVNPGKATNIAGIIEKYKGREYVLFNKLRNLYKEDPWKRQKEETVSNLDKAETPKEDASIDIASKRVEELEEELLKKREEITQLHSEIQKRDAFIDTSSQQIEELQNQMEEKDRVMERMEKEKREMEVSSKTLKSSIVKYTKKNEELEKEVAEQKEIIQKKEEAESLAKQQAEGVDVNQLIEEVKSLKDEIVVMGIIKKEKEEELKLKDCQLKEFERVQSEKEELERRYKEMEQERLQMINQMNQLEEKVGALTVSLSYKKKHLEKQNDSELAMLRKRVEEIEEERKAVDHQNGDLLLEIQRLKHDFEKVKESQATTISSSSSQSIEDHLTEVNQRNEELEILITKYQQERKQFEEKNALDQERTAQEITRLMGEKDQMEAELKERKETLMENESALSQIRQKNEELEERVKDILQQKEEIEEDLKKKEACLAETAQNLIILQEEIKERSEALQKQAEQCEEMQKSNEALIQDKISLQREVESMKQDMKEVKEQLADDLYAKLTPLVQSSAIHSSAPTIMTMKTQTLLEYMTSIITTLEGEPLSTVDMPNQMNETSLRVIQDLLLDRVQTVKNIIIHGIVMKTWDEEDGVEACHSCMQPFSLTNRKHHCRYCGNAFCSKCSNKTIILIKGDKKQRVCEECYLILSRVSSFI